MGKLREGGGPLVGHFAAFSQRKKKVLKSCGILIHQESWMKEIQLLTTTTNNNNNIIIITNKEFLSLLSWDQKRKGSQN